MKHYAIIVAGGSGTRMGNDLPKQFHELAGLPIIMHSINAFAINQYQPEIILVLNVHYHDVWNLLCKKHQFNIPISLVNGGNNRFESVRKGLKNVPDKSIVAIHDAVRPLVSQDSITNCYQSAMQYGSGVSGMPSNDSVRLLRETGSIGVKREEVYLMQTPQTFKSELIKKAYEQEFRIDFTDCASVADRIGIPIHLVKGTTSNIKITYPQDLLLAELLLKNNTSS